VLLIGGFGEGPDDRSLAFLTEHYQVLIPQFPAFGRISDVADATVALLDHLEIERATILGPSIGGAIAQVLTRRHPSRVEALILANTSPPIGWGAYVHGLVLAVLGRLPVGGLRWLLARGATRMAKDSDARQRFERALATASREDLLSVFQYARDYCRHWRFEPGDLDAWPGRVLILESDRDPGVPRSAQRRLRELYPGATIHTFVGGGHTPAITRPEEFRTTVLEFLAA